MYRRLMMITLAFTFAGCGEPNPLTAQRIYCNDTRQCPPLTDDANSFCLFDGVTGTFCVVSDQGCASKWRWYKYSRIELADKCVDPSLVGQDGGVRG